MQLVRDEQEKAMSIEEKLKFYRVRVLGLFMPL